MVVTHCSLFFERVARIAGVSCLLSWSLAFLGKRQEVIVWWSRYQLDTQHINKPAPTWNDERAGRSPVREMAVMSPRGRGVCELE